jgi:outer membrane protein TolC
MKIPSNGSAVFILLFSLFLQSTRAPGQTGTQPAGASTSSSSSSGTAGASITPTQNSFSGSVPEGKATAEVLQLSFQDAIDRGLRNNLGVLLQQDNQLFARGQRWKELSALLPNVTTATAQSVEQIDLAAQGIRFNIPGIPPVIGPIGVFDARVYLQQTVLDFNKIEKERGARANQTAALYSYKDARDLVVLATGNSYLQAIAYAATVETAQAQVTTAQTLYDNTYDQQQAGTSPAIDTLRARVELLTRQQQLIAAKNNFAKEKLALARVIGLPTGQEFALIDKVPFEPLAALSVDDATQRAYASRSDYQAALQQVRAAEYSRKAATAEYFPTVDIAGNYGAAGVNVGDSRGVFEVGATLAIPVFQGGKVHADVLQSEATLRQSRQQLDNLRAQIDFDVRTALLDLTSAADQVEVARSSVDLANQTLVQARDRFTAGVTDNLEVVQAQESVASADESYISSLYSHNLAKVALARAMGFAEQGVKLYLRSK